MDYQFETSVQYLKGVGPQVGARLESIGIKSLFDLIQYVPRTYQNWKVISSIKEIDGKSNSILKANLLNVRSFRRGPLRQFELLFEDAERYRFRARFFRQPYKGYFEKFRCPTPLWVLGAARNFRGQWEFHHPELKESMEAEEAGERIVPVYSETVGLSSKVIHKLVAQAFERLEASPLWDSKDYIPSWLRKSYGIAPLKSAFFGLHFPKVGDEKAFLERQTEGQKRLIFEDFFWMELTLALRKKSYTQEKALALALDHKKSDAFRKQIPFSLTGNQVDAIEEISKDLEKSIPMNRLLQGDVGSGKTIVIFSAVIQAMAAGAQAALMAPTEILAEQHFKSALNLMGPLGYRLGLLHSKLKKAERDRIFEALRSGQIDFVVGTHSLIEDAVEFLHLGLVIVDEQHRFGVEQRRRLQCKGISPHRLLVTATPIPRTLALTAFGDLEMSFLREKPPGRTPIVSKIMSESQRPLFYDFLLKQLGQGRQAYFVYPLVEESEKSELKSATEAFQQHQMQFPMIRWGLLHGKMKGIDKEKVMTEFRRGDIQVLVSTTVIEVGVDIPNAVIMLIEHAERFGLSQLHQLRGRVGRGSDKSYCIFALGDRVSMEAQARLQLMCETEDGFKIAEADLQWRGPGEFLGSSQSGTSGFRWADLFKDQSVAAQAKAAVSLVFDRDPNLEEAEHQPLLNYWKRLPWIHTS